MKSLRILCLVWVVCLTGRVFAQDSVEGEMALFGFSSNVNVVFYQDATAGTLTPNTDGTYTLSLQGIPAEIDITQVSPATTETLSTADLVNDWNTSISDIVPSLPVGAPNPYFAEGELDIQGDTAYVTITGISYDEASQTIQYTVTLDQFVSLDILQNQPYDLANASTNPKEIPAQFGAVTFAIGGNNAFLQALKEAAMNRIGAVRMGEETVSCETVASDIADYQDQLDTLNAQVVVLLTAVDQTSWTDEYLQQYATLNEQMKAIKIELRYSQVWYRANCGE